MRNSIFLIFSALFLILDSCSSLPDKGMKVSATANTADARYEAANSELSAGNFALASTHFVQAYNLAYSVDYADLLCRISLSGISLKIASSSLDPTNKKSDSFIDSKTVEQILEDAKYFAGRTGREKVLLSVCSIYECEIALCRGKRNFLIYENSLKGAEDGLKKEPYYQAHLYRTLGEVYASEKKYDLAVEYYTKAATLHTKKKILAEIGTDWYGAARAYSLSGRKSEAVSAMESALKYDRDAENTGAIAADYLALAKILSKGKPNADEKQRARDCASWAAAIYRSVSLEKNAAECDKFAASVK